MPTKNVVVAAASLLVLNLANNNKASAATLWPQPTQVTVDNSSFVQLDTAFKFVANGTAASESKLLQRAFERYESILQIGNRHPAKLNFELGGEFGSSKSNGGIAIAQDDDDDDDENSMTTLSVVLETKEAPLTFGVDEAYTLVWDFTKSASASATLQAQTVYGALRGLETFVQLAEGDNVAHEEPLQVPVATSITDSPRFP